MTEARHDKKRGKAFFGNAEAAADAVALALPMLEAALRNPVIGESGFLYVVVMDPASDPAVDDFDSSILYEYAVGDREKWDAPYDRFARDKARVSWRTRRDGHAVRVGSPHLLANEDCGIWGSAWVDGIAVGVSGANPWYDEAFAASIAHCFKAAAKGRAQAEREAPRLGSEQ